MIDDIDISQFPFNTFGPKHPSNDFIPAPLPSTNGRHNGRRGRIGAKERRKADVRIRATSNSLPKHCVVHGCTKPTRRAAGKGLDGRYCRRHADHYSRHGSPYKGSYTSSELAQFRLSASAWLNANRDDLWANSAIERIQPVIPGRRSLCGGIPATGPQRPGSRSQSVGSLTSSPCRTD